MSGRGLLGLLAVGGGLAYWAHKQEDKTVDQEEEFLSPLEELAKEVQRERDAAAKQEAAQAAATESQVEVEAEAVATEDLKEGPESRKSKVNGKRKKR